MTTTRKPSDSGRDFRTHARALRVALTWADLRIADGAIDPLHSGDIEDEALTAVLDALPDRAQYERERARFEREVAGTPAADTWLGGHHGPNDTTWFGATLESHCFRGAYLLGLAVGSTLRRDLLERIAAPATTRRPGGKRNGGRP